MHFLSDATLGQAWHLLELGQYELQDMTNRNLLED